jgi:tyrosyl-tRNA synthetase
MNLIEDLKARGLIEHHSADLEKIFAQKRTVYIGTDPTADSLHVGHLTWLLLLKRLGIAGHSLIVLVGGGTGMIGDPREVGERVLLDEATLRRNVRSLKTQIQHVLGTLRFRMVDNADWLKKVHLIDFLRDVGKHFTVNDLIKRDLIKRRIDTPNESISYTEFTYSLLQAYDYRELNKKYGCDLQMGGSDQWTNVLSGVDLIRKKDGKEVFALAFPLVTDATGKKFGKSEGNAVWLDPKRTSPFAFYQYWIGQDDRNVANYLKIFTFLPVNEINALIELHERNPERRVAHKKLAYEVTSIVHGEGEAKRAEKFTDVLFGASPFDSLSGAERDSLFSAVPSASLTRDASHSIVEVLTMTDFISSKSEAKRLIDSKGIRLNGQTIETDRSLEDGDFHDGLAILQKGKSEKLLVRFK